VGGGGRGAKGPKGLAWPTKVGQAKAKRPVRKSCLRGPFSRSICPPLPPSFSCPKCKPLFFIHTNPSTTSDKKKGPVLSSGGRGTKQKESLQKNPYLLVFNIYINII